MKKVLFLFYNAGAGIHVANSMIEDAVRALPLSAEFEFCKEFSNFSNETYYLSRIREHSPDIIITQDFFTGIINAAAEYKNKDNQSCKILVFSFTDYADTEISGLASVDAIYLPFRSRMPNPSNTKMFYPPLSLRQFSKKVRWGERKELFCSVGRLISTKVSPELIEGLSSRQLSYDYYASLPTVDGTDKARDEKIFNDIAALSYSFTSPCRLHPALTRYQVPRVLNRYKYHLLLAEDDCFSIITLEAMACGTVPVLICSKRRREDLLSWIPDGFGLHYETVSAFLQDSERLALADYAGKSERESLYIRSQFNQADFYARVHTYFVD